MYPENETYGSWPRSGEIDIAQSRGNDPKEYSDGRDTVSSTLHWAPSKYLDQSSRTTGQLVLRRQDLSKSFHTYGLEWSEKHLFTWIDDRTWQIEKTGWGSGWGGNMWQRGGFGQMWDHGTL
jgi:beta-glucanase (GH16 family)